MLRRKGPSAEKQEERGRESQRFRGTGHRMRREICTCKVWTPAQSRPGRAAARPAPNSAKCTFVRLCPTTGRADPATERGLYPGDVYLVAMCIHAPAEACSELVVFQDGPIKFSSDKYPWEPYYVGGKKGTSFANL